VNYTQDTFLQSITFIILAIVSIILRPIVPMMTYANIVEVNSFTGVFWILSIIEMPTVAKNGN